MYYYMTCRFITNKGLSPTNYLYEIPYFCYDDIKLGRRYQIKDDKGYTYSNSSVEVTGMGVTDEKLTEYLGKSLKKVTITNSVSHPNAVYNDTFDKMITSNLTKSLSLGRSLDNTITINNFITGTYKSYYDAVKDYQKIAGEYELYPNNTERIKATKNGTLVNLGDGLITVSYDNIEIPMTISAKDMKYFSYDSDRATIEKIENKKGEKTMNFFNNLTFGKYTGRDLKVSFKGMAVRTAEGKYNAYDIATNDVTDVSDFLLDVDFIYMMPVALKDISRGDVIKHNGNFVIVRDVRSDGTLEAVNVGSNELVSVLPVKNMFGFNFYTKVLNLFNMNMSTASGDSPFGNMLPLMMMQDENFDPMTMMLLMNNGNGSTMFDNPMMMMMLLNKDNDMSKGLIMAMMMQQGGFNSVNPIKNDSAAV